MMNIFTFLFPLDALAVPAMLTQNQTSSAAQKPATSAALVSSHSLLGKILATIAMSAIDAGVIATDPTGLITNPNELAEVIAGFLSIWTSPVSTSVSSAELSNIKGRI